MKRISLSLKADQRSVVALISVSVLLLTTVPVIAGDGDSLAGYRSMVVGEQVRASGVAGKFRNGDAAGAGSGVHQGFGDVEGVNGYRGRIVCVGEGPLSRDVRSSGDVDSVGGRQLRPGLYRTLEGLVFPRPWGR